MAIAVSTLSLPQANALNLTPLPSQITQPIGIAYQEAGNFIVVSCNRDTENAPKFNKIDANGVVSNYGIYVNNQLPVTEFPVIGGTGKEIKLAAIRRKLDGSAPSGGFTSGEIFCSDSRGGNIMRIGADGKVAGPTGGFPTTWLHLPTSGIVQGIAHDREGVLGGYLVVATSTGGTSHANLWLVNSSAQIVGGQPLSTGSSLPSNIESIVVVPNNPGRYGQIAGQILVGADNQTENPPQLGLFSVNPTTGAVIQWFVNGSGALTSNPSNATPIAAEDLDLISSSENFYTVNFSGGGLFNVAPSSGQLTAGMDGDILITQEGAGPGTVSSFQRLQASNGALSLINLTAVPAPVFEHSTFGPVATLQVVSIEAGLSSTVEPDINNPSPTPATFVVKRNTPGAELVVSLQFYGAAGFGTDYSASPVPATGPRTVTIPDGQTQVEISIAAVDDSRQESAETVVCQIISSSSPTYQIAAPPFNTATVTILGNDTVPQPTSWQLIDLGILDAGDQSTAYAIANPVDGASSTTALITGSSTFAAGNANTRAFRSVGGGAISAISTSSSQVWHIGYGASSAGAIVGSYLLSGTTCPRAFFWSGTGPLILLDGLGFNTEGRDINNAGNIAGGSMNGAVKYRAVGWNFDSVAFNILDLGTLAGQDQTKSSYAYAVNNNNRVVGKSATLASSSHAFRTQPGSLIRQINITLDDLGTLPGYDTSEAYDINDLDEVVGISGTYGVFWPGTGAPASQNKKLLPPFSSGAYDYTMANSINKLGIIAGARWSGVFGKWLMVLWWNSANPTSLDVLPLEGGFPTISSVTVVGGGYWDLKNVLSINDRNWVVGWGYRNGGTKPRAFLLRPTISP